MNNYELNELLYRTDFQANVKGALLHWAHHWGVIKAAELEALTPESYKNQRIAMIEAIFSDPDAVTERMARMVIQAPEVKTLGCYHAVTEAVVKAAVDKLLGSSVRWFFPNAG